MATISENLPTQSRTAQSRVANRREVERVVLFRFGLGVIAAAVIVFIASPLLAACFVASLNIGGEQLASILTASGGAGGALFGGLGAKGIIPHGFKLLEMSREWPDDPVQEEEEEANTS